MLLLSDLAMFDQFLTYCRKNWRRKRFLLQETVWIDYLTISEVETARPATNMAAWQVQHGSRRLCACPHRNRSVHASSTVSHPPARTRTVCTASSAAGAGDLPQPGGSSSSSSTSGDGLTQQQAGGPFQRVKAWLGSGKLDKQKLAEYGLGGC